MNRIFHCARPVSRALSWLLILALAANLQMPLARAEVFTVTTTNSSGPGSLLSVVTQANESPGTHTIEFAVSGTLKPSQPLPVITKNLSISVRSTNTVLIDGQQSMPIFRFAAGTTNILHRLQLVHGRSEEGGGAIRNEGVLFLTRCTLAHNVSGGPGGAILNTGELTLVDSKLVANRGSSGGGLFSQGEAELTGCILQENRAGRGAGIFNEGNLTVRESTLWNNTSEEGKGGGIYNSGALTLKASTLYENTAIGSPGANGTHGFYFLKSNGERKTVGAGGGGGGGGAGFGGGVYMASGTAELINCTLSDNRALGGAGGRGGNGEESVGSVFIGGNGGDGGGNQGGQGGSGFYPGSFQQAGDDGGFGSGGGGGGGAGVVLSDGQAVGSPGGSGGYGGGDGGKGGSLASGHLIGVASLGLGGEGGTGGSGLGGAFFCEAGTVTLLNCTLTGNKATSGKGGTGGLAQRDPTRVASSGQTGQGLGGGLLNHSGTVELTNTIVAGNTSDSGHPDLSGSFVSSGFNLVGDREGAGGLSINDFQDLEALLGPLQDNGGPTWTCALLPGSPAIGAGTSQGAPEKDQRGADRPPGEVDIGAFQVVTRIAPTLTWNEPDDILVGTPLGEDQLNASTAVPGTLAYDPPLDAVLPVGDQILTVVFTPEDRINFTPAETSVTITVLKKTQTIAFPPLPDRHQDDPPFFLDASASSGLPVEFQLLAGPALLSDHLLTLNGTTGQVRVRAVQPGNEEYEPAPVVEQSFQVVGDLNIQITQSPISRTVTVGDRVVLSVEAEGPGLRYQWQFQQTDIPGETGSTLTLSKVSQGQAGEYRVRVSNESGSMTTASSVLSVRPKVIIGSVAGEISISWGFGVLQSSIDLKEWNDISEAQSPFSFSPEEPRRFYRIRSD